MTVDVAYLHEKVAAVCPITSVSVGVETDKATWLFFPTAAATAQQKQDAQTVINNYDPATVAPRDKYDNAIAAGANLTWTTSTGLNGLYPLDTATMNALVATWTHTISLGTFPSGQALQRVLQSNGTVKQMSQPQFKAFMGALMKYLDALQTARQQEEAGGTPTWPSNNITVTG